MHQIVLVLWSQEQKELNMHIVLVSVNGLDSIMLTLRTQNEQGEQKNQPVSIEKYYYRGFCNRKFKMVLIHDERFC